MENTERKPIVLSAIQPTSIPTLGNYLGALRNWKLMCEDYDCLYAVADLHALTIHPEPAKLRQQTLEMYAILLSVGLDPEKNVVFIQSQVPAHAELAWILDCYTQFGEASRMTQFKEKSLKNAGNVNVGLFAYPVLMAADILLYQPDYVPVGEDQKPMLEQAVEIVRSFNRIYGETLVEPKAVLPSNAACLRLPGTDGKAKMSKSLGNCIYLAESADEMHKKVMSMYTDPQHINVSDPGHVEGNTVFTYLDAFCRDEHFGLYLPEYANLDELKDHYRRGGLGDVKVKRFLEKILNEELEPIRARRKEYEKDIPAVYEILKKGSEDAEAVAAATLDEVKKAMRIDYFNDKALIEEQAKRFNQ